MGSTVRLSFHGGFVFQKFFFFSSTESPPVKIQDVRQSLEKLMKRRTRTHIHEKNETSDDGWTNGKHWETRTNQENPYKASGRSHIWKITCQRSYWSMLAGFSRDMNETHLRKSLVGCAEWTLHQLFTATLKTLRVMTRNAADHLALKPTATITHAIKPNSDRNARPMFHSPWRTKPRKRKMRRTRPARRKLKAYKISVAGERSCVLFSAVILADARDTSKQLLAGHHRVAEYHEETPNDRKVAEEKCHVKDETIAESLNNNHCEKTCDTVFCMTLCYNRTRANDHCLPKYDQHNDTSEGGGEDLRGR
jgi:hypothetical protein